MDVLLLLILGFEFQDKNQSVNFTNRKLMLPTLSTDEYFAELSKWFGVSSGDLSYVLPNIDNFYNANSGDLPIGFMDY